ncbi:MAG: efflux RND transporter permease subunit, partial [Planctomycetota bacterium]
ISMKENQNVVQLGADVDALVDRFVGTSLPPDVRVERMNDLPRQVDSLVAGFMESLWQAVAIVLGVALLMMGWRPALVMSTAIPLSMISTIAVVPYFGVELEQFAIASLIIVLGMVVDNAIVVTDNVQRLIDEGVERSRAAIDGAHTLARAILSSTLTTVAAFVPMLSITGETGEYMRSLPIVVSATLLSSYLVAMTVTPIMCTVLLRPSKTTGGETGRVGALYLGFVRRAIAARVVTLAVTGAMLLGSLSLTPLIGSQFFPGGVRDQLFVDVTLPTGASLEATEAVVAQVEQILVDTSQAEVDGETVERLLNATAFVGTGGPRLFLSLDPSDGVPNEATIIVNTTSDLVSRPWVAELRRAVGQIPDARIDVRPYELGPPVDNPVEYRLTGSDLTVMREAGLRLLETIQGTPGVLGANQDWGELARTVDLDVDLERAYLAGVSSGAVSSSLRELYGGTSLTSLREGDHLVDVVLRLPSEQRESSDSLPAVYVDGDAGPVPLVSVAEVGTGHEPATIGRRNRRRTMTLGGRVAPGLLANEVSQELFAELEPIVRELPAGYSLEIGGEFEETATSQTQVVNALKISVVLIFLVLLIQYNSMSKPAVVLLAFPLSLIGALLGLFLTGWPLGFMPMLGIVALAGTVINNAIVLIDFIETTVSDGVPLREAVAKAGLARMQPILLTTLTTVGGMLPLALFGGPMWAGMSWAIIFGLSLSTVLTLVVIPTVYVLFAERFRMQVGA